ncbi:MAG TPA: hypothetical protein VHR45_14840 [Thermoanaerobaculia bacterium]|nr:hypothetical protein [Thermoanaerobaculia bacterium]
MDLSGLFAVFCAGCFGGLLPELPRWHRLRFSPRLPHYAKRPSYWIVTAAMIVCGGVLTTLYGTGI